MAEKLEKPPGGLPRSIESEETYKTSDPRPHYVELDALRGSPVLKPVLGFRPLVFLGKISYSLFLLHSTVMIMVIYYTPDVIRTLLVDQSELTVLTAFVAFTFFMLAVAGALAYLSYRCVESPFMRRKPK